MWISANILWVKGLKIRILVITIVFGMKLLMVAWMLFNIAISVEIIADPATVVIVVNVVAVVVVVIIIIAVVAAAITACALMLTTAEMAGGS